MYTLVPFQRRRNLARSNNYFGDHFLRSFFDMGEFMQNSGFRVDVKDKEDHYLMEAEMPGVSEDQISVTVDKDVLTISADVNSEKKEEKENYVYSERRVGHMERSFSLEGITQEDITADYVNGVLTLKLPKSDPKEAKTQRKIAIGKQEDHKQASGE